MAVSAPEEAAGQLSIRAMLSIASPAAIAGVPALNVNFIDG
jgi:hypothetical protein